VPELALDDDQRHALAGDASQLAAAAAAAQGRPRVAPLTTQNSRPIDSSTRAWSQGASCSRGAGDPPQE
jgi:hypothetical protein